MMEYSKHIEVYSNYVHSSFSKLVAEGEWGNKKVAEDYLKKYWLSGQEYLTFWKPVQDKIFQNNDLPDLVFQSDFKILALRGGCLFVEEDFNLLQNALLQLGEDYFTVIQHSQDFTEREPMFRMKYPTNITWDELVSGNYISAVLFEMPYNNYYVFGTNGNWGKYSANDYEHPIDIIGFKPELASIFREEFEQPKEEKEEIWEWLPQEYKKLNK